MRSNLILFLALWLILFTGSCKKFMDVAPPDSMITAEDAYANDSAATTALIGVCMSVMETTSLLNGNGSKQGGLYVGEIMRNDPPAGDTGFINRNLSAGYRPIGENWKYCYRYVTASNAIIENLLHAVHVTDSTKRRLTAEAKFLRALSYFYLVNFWGDVPIVTGTDFMDNAWKSRYPVDILYGHITADLKEAAAALPQDYGELDNMPGRRVRPTKWAALTLLARVHLYRRSWSEAEKVATEVIDSGRFRLAAVQDVFLATSMETILQFSPTQGSGNTSEAAIFLTMVKGKPVYGMADKATTVFDGADERKKHWLNATVVDGKTVYVIYKYKEKQKLPHAEYNIAFRMAEVLLIRAEARARQYNLAGAVNDINTVRNRAKAGALQGSLTQHEVLLALARERQAEFFAEWAHTFLDLKRWYLMNDPSDPLCQLAQSNFQATPGWAAWKLRWPVPQDEIDKNSNLVQNEGYAP